MNEPRRWLMVLVGLSLLVSLVWMRRQPVEKSPHADCPGHGNCLKAERCPVFPEGDGLATTGRWVDRCEGDLACRAQFHCADFREAGGYLLPKAAKDADGAMVYLCVPWTRLD
jgi:hypothetical protein